MQTKYACVTSQIVESMGYADSSCGRITDANRSLQGGFNGVAAVVALPLLICHSRAGLLV